MQRNSIRLLKLVLASETEHCQRVAQFRVCSLKLMSLEAISDGAPPVLSVCPLSKAVHTSDKCST